MNQSEPHFSNEGEVRFLYEKRSIFCITKYESFAKKHIEVS